MAEEKKRRRRDRGDGSVYKVRGSQIWWLGYVHSDGRRRAESSGSKKIGEAQALLRKRIGARDNGLAVIPYVERTTFAEGAQAVLDDFSNTGKKSGDEVARRIDKHLRPYFGGKRLAGITSADVRAYTAKRKQDVIVVRKARMKGDQVVEPEVTKPVSNAEVNRELQTLKRILNLARKDGRLASVPHIALLQENNVRQGFFEAEQMRSLLRHLPGELQPVIEFAYITGWRIASEVLPLEWRHVDFAGGEVRLAEGTTKNREGRVFNMTVRLRALLQARQTEHERLRKAGQVEPKVFFRMVAEGRRGPKKPQPILALTKAWKAACLAAGCPGRIPHDLRRTAVRNMVRAGIAESVAMKMSGHKTRSVFERYNITSPSDLREAARKLDAVSA